MSLPHNCERLKTLERRMSIKVVTGQDTDATPPHGLPNLCPRKAVMSSSVAEQMQGPDLLQHKSIAKAVRFAPKCSDRRDLLKGPPSPRHRPCLRGTLHGQSSALLQLGTWFRPGEIQGDPLQFPTRPEGPASSCRTGYVALNTSLFLVHLTVLVLCIG